MTSEEEALEAEDGGADRLEMVRALAVGGLTPDTELVRRVLHRVRVPVRVILRETATLEASGPSELERLRRGARELAELSIDGLVVGFARERRVDAAATAAVLECAPDLKATFHRAFDETADPLRAIADLKSLPQIDRILTSGGPGDWEERRKRLKEWKTAAGGTIKLLVAAGLCACTLAGLRLEPCLEEVHVGRAAREPQTVDGKVCRRRVAALKSALG